MNVTLTYDVGAKKWSGPLPTNLDGDQTLVLAFGPSDLVDQPQALAEIVRAFPRAQVLGCSSAGGVVGSEVREGTLVVTVAKLEKTTMSGAQAQLGPNADAFTAGQAIAKKLSKPSLRAVIVLSDGIDASGAELVRGLNSALDQSIVVVGGLAGDGTRFRRTWVLSGTSVKSGMVAAVGLYGEHVLVAHSSRSGWSKVGSELTVTKADGRVVYELDGKPALSVYEERMKTAGVTSPLALPVAVRATSRHDKVLVRSVLGVDAAKQSLRLSVDVPQGYLMQPLSSTPANLVDAAREASSSTKDTIAPVGANALVLAVSHAARHEVLGAKAAEEVAAAVSALPEGPTPQVTGFFGYGEIAPYAAGHADLHNQSFTVAMIMESPTPVARKATRGLAAGAARAQGAATAAGPAAHLRSRSQTVDDLFLELEVEGGVGGIERKGGARGAAKPGVPPPVPPRRPPSSAPAPPSSQNGRKPLGSPAESDGALRARSRMPTPRVVDVASALANDRRGLSVTAVSHDGRSHWSADPLPSDADSPQTLVLAFGSPIPDPTDAANAPSSPLEDLIKTFPRSHVIGCATNRLARKADGKMAVSIVQFKHTELQTAWADMNAGAALAGQSIAESLARPDLRAVLVFADATAGDGGALVRSLTGGLPSNVAVSGGLVAPEGDGAWLLCGTKLRTGIAVAVGLYGDHVMVVNGSRTGFDAFGPERKVTRATGNVVYELDGKPALKMYAEYTGQREALRPGAALPYPLCWKRGDELVVRVPTGFDATEQSITFASELPQGAVVRLMRADHEKLLSEVTLATGAASIGAAAGGALVMAVSSVGRALALGDRAEEELESVAESLPRENRPHLTGFYSVAEVGSPGKGGRAEIQNGSISVTVVTESATPIARPDAATERRTTPAPPMSSNPAETPSPPQALRPSQRPGSGFGNVPRRKHEVTRPVASGVGVPAAAAAAAKVVKSQRGDVLLVTFSGRLSESFKGNMLGRELSGTVVFDLGNVERITSFGVREWLAMLTAAQEKAKKIYFAHCSEAVVNQLSMIRKFAGSGQVVSFFAPYLCDSCGEQFERLFDCEIDAEAIRGNEPPESICQRCSGKGRFDDDPETYFAFAPNHVGQPIPDNVRALLNEIDAAAPAAANDAIEKTIDGDVTRVRVQTKLGGAVRWQRILDGIEGALVIDLGAVGGLEPTGVANFEHALTALGPEVDSIKLERCPQLVVERFAQSGLPRRVVLSSLVVTGFCPSCNVQRPAVLVPDEHAAALIAGREPTLHCKRCNGPLSLVDAGEIVQFLSRQRRRASTRPSAAPPRQSLPPNPGPSIAAPSQAPAAAQASLPPASFAQPERSGRGIITGAAILAVAILASAGFFTVMRQRAAGTANDLPPTTKAGGAASWSAADLPPSWVERSFGEENGTLLIVGRGDHAPTADAALAQARNEAIARIIKQLAVDLNGTPAAEFYTAHSLKDDQAKARASQIAERYLRQVGAFAQPDRKETVVRQRDGGMEAFARYHLPRAAYNQALASYKATASFQGMTVARSFPLLDLGPNDGDLVVISVAKGRGADSVGVRVGDFVLGMNGKPVSSLESFNKVSDDFNAVGPGGTFDVELNSVGIRSTVKIKKVAPTYVAAPPAPPAPPPPAVTPRVEAPRPAPPAAPPKDKDLGIIPPSRNF